MLQEVCESIHNYFIKSSQRGTYEITGGMIPLSFVKEGQRILIAGSDLNDGIYTYHSDGLKDDDDAEAAGLKDETFAGTICALAVPPTLIALSREIKEWVETYGETVNSPYTSESVLGEYSYQKATTSKAEGSTPVLGWQDMFAQQLNRWRKVSF